MSSSIAVQRRLVVPRISELVDSITATTSAALVNFERNAANARYAEEVSQVAQASLASQWMHSMPMQSTSRLGKAGSIAVVVVVHALALYALSSITPKVNEEKPALLQVVTIDTPQSTQETPPLPVSVSVQRLPNITLPIEPVIDIAVADSAAITVVPRPSEPTAANSAAAGAPKLVSSVEYIREPIAKYPPAARALKQHGIVMLRALIDPTGHASEVNVHRSSGYRLLDDTARNAVAKALFKPYSENGHSIPVYVFIPIEFGTSG